MYYTITLSEAMWGHLFLLPDLTRGGLKKAITTESGHHLCPDFEDGKIRVGKHAGAGGYGFIRDLDPEAEGLVPKERELIRSWLARPNRNGDDYYIALSERGGEQFVTSRDMEVGPGYPQRLFVWGEDEDGKPLPRWELFRLLHRAGIRSHPDFWDPVTIWHGYNRGLPTFHNGLRAVTEMGARYYETKATLSRLRLPGYTWEQASPYYGHLYVEE